MVAYLCFDLGKQTGDFLAMDQKRFTQAPTGQESAEKESSARAAQFIAEASVVRKPC